ncbi:MAG: universal stress protein, partial [Gammaproteobacteria bacterium]
AKEKNSDFIVIGMRGRGRTLNETLMGDTARHVLHNAKVPVLVVPPCDDKKLNKEKQGDSKVVSLKG